MSDIPSLLAKYSKTGSEAAFRELTERYLNLVYSTALRLVNGDSHLAEDIAQTVFTDFAQSAKNLSGEVRLGGWMHRHTFFVAAKTLRSERRRQARERRAAEMNPASNDPEASLASIAPILDEAINQLRAADRAAILLRFYEQLDFRSVGQAMGTNEAAAQKRVSRALGKLQGLLKHRGITLSAVALGTLLTAHAVTAAPAGLAVGISGAALTGASSQIGTTSSLLKLMASLTLKNGAVAAIIAAGVVTPLLLQHQASARMVERDNLLNTQSAQLAQLAADNQRLSNQLATAQNAASPDNAQLSQVLKLRSEAGLLRKSAQTMTDAKSAPLSREEQLDSLRQMYATHVNQLKAWLDAHPSEKIPELMTIPESIPGWTPRAETKLKTASKQTAAVLRANAEPVDFSYLYRKPCGRSPKANKPIPTDLSQLRPYFPIADGQGRAAALLAIVPSASLVSDLQSGMIWGHH